MVAAAGRGRLRAQTAGRKRQSGGGRILLRMGECYDVKKNNKRADKVTRKRSREPMHNPTPRVSVPFF